MKQGDWKRIIKKKRESRLRESTHSNRIRRILLLVCIGIAVVCGVVLAVDFYRQYKVEQEYQKMCQEAYKEETTEKETVEAQENVDKSIDFQTLWQTNEDIYGWIEIPNTDIAYPIVQHKNDDSYYLNHTVEHQAGLPGSIYSEKFSKTDFSDFIHIIYGHNMKNGTMFAQLHKYEDTKFFDKNDKIIIYTPEHVYTYEIFASIVNDDRHIMYSYDFTTQEGRQNFLDDIYENTDERNQYREELMVTTEDRILVLSTCMDNEENRRYLVTAVLVDENNRDSE